MSLTTSENGDVTLSKLRHDVCYSAAAELEFIALMLPDAVELSDELALASRMRVRCMAARVLALANALLAGLGDDAAPVHGFDGLNRAVLLFDDVAAGRANSLGKA